MVTVDVIKRDDCVVDLDIFVNRKELEYEFDVAAKELSSSIKFAGFRKGKVPRSILEGRMGKDLEKRAIAKLLPKAYAEAIEKAKIIPLIPPKIWDIDYKKDGYLKFRAQVEVGPEISEEDYKGITLKKRIKRVREEDIEEGLKDLQMRNAELIGIDDRPVRKGDIITIDYEGLVDETPIPGAKAENILIEIGKTRLLPGVEDELIGLRLNTAKEIRVRLPDDYKAKEFAGRMAIFKINLKAIKERRLPIIDDEFARDLGKCDLNELKKAIKADLECIKEEESRTNLKKRLIEVLISKCNFSVPAELVEREVDVMVEEFGKDLAPLGLTIDRYLKERDLTIERLRDDFRTKAIENLKAGLILDTIAKKEKIKISEEELQLNIDRIAESLATTPQEMRRLLVERDELNALLARMRIDKTIDFILKQSNIEEVYED